MQMREENAIHHRAGRATVIKPLTMGRRCDVKEKRRKTERNEGVSRASPLFSGLVRIRANEISIRRLRASTNDDEREEEEEEVQPSVASIAD